MEKLNDYIEKTTQIDKLIKSKIGDKPKTIDWAVLNLVPEPFETKTGPKDSLSAVYQAFKAHTNIPIELPVFCLFAYVSAFLVKNESKVKVEGMSKPLELDLWLINLAQSGSSKTLSSKLIEDSIPLDAEGYKAVFPNFEQVAGAAAFVTELRDKNRGFYLQDECGQLLKQIENIGSPLAELKKYLLMTYDHSPVSRKTKQDTITVENPTLTVLWLNTIEGFLKAISEESLQDGFSQRFLYVWALKDTDRAMEDYALYRTDKIDEVLANPISELFSAVPHSEYTISKDVVQLWTKAFASISANHFDKRINESFYRRVLFSAYKYAVVFHLILGKKSIEIDEEDMTYALKTCLFHLHSLESLLTAKTEGFEDKVEKEKKLLNKIKQFQDEQLEKNKELTARMLCRKFSAIKTAAEANEYLTKLKEEDPSAKAAQLASRLARKHKFKTTGQIEEPESIW